MRAAVIAMLALACGGQEPAPVHEPVPLPTLSQSCQVELDSLWAYALDLSARMDAAQSQIVTLQSVCGVTQ